MQEQTDKNRLISRNLTRMVKGKLSSKIMAVSFGNRNFISCSLIKNIRNEYKAPEYFVWYIYYPCGRVICLVFFKEIKTTIFAFNYILLIFYDLLNLSLGQRGRGEWRCLGWSSIENSSEKYIFCHFSAVQPSIRLWALAYATRFLSCLLFSTGFWAAIRPWRPLRARI